MTTLAQPRTSLLERAIATLDVFPVSQASVIQNVMTMTSSVDTDFDALAKALSTDQALTGKVIRLSNSPFYGRMRSVASLTEAIRILGFQTIRSLVVATSTSSMFRKGADQELEEKLWAHALAVAIGARTIARERNPLSAEEGFLGGLLHDIAQLVLLQRFPKEYKPALTEMSETQADLVEIEERHLGFNHMELGAKVLEHWNFPELLLSIVLHHHHPEAFAGDDGDCDPSTVDLVHIVAFADHLAEWKNYGLGVYGDQDASGLAAIPSAEHLGLSEEDVVRLGDTLVEMYTETEQCFND